MEEKKITLITKKESEAPFLRLLSAFPTYIKEKSKVEYITRVQKSIKTDGETFILNQVDVDGIPFDKTTLVLQKIGDEKINKFLARTNGIKIVTTSQSVFNYYKLLIDNNHSFLGVLPFPVNEYYLGKAEFEEGENLKVAWSNHIPIEATFPKWEVTKTKDGDPYKNNYNDKHVSVCSSEEEATESLSCGVPVILIGESNYIKEGINGFTISKIPPQPSKKLLKTIAELIPKAAKLNQINCLSTITSLVLGTENGYQTKYADIISEITNTKLVKENATVTVGVQVEGIRVEDIKDISIVDETIESLLSQTYKDFTTILLVNGPKTFAESISKRYNLPFHCTDDLPIENPLWLHDKAMRESSSKYYKPIENKDVLSKEYLSISVEELEKGADVYACESPLSFKGFKNKDGSYKILPSSSLIKTNTCIASGGYLGENINEVWAAMEKNGAIFILDKTSHLTRCMSPIRTKNNTVGRMIKKITFYSAIMTGIAGHSKHAIASIIDIQKDHPQITSSQTQYPTKENAIEPQRTAPKIGEIKKGSLKKDNKYSQS